MKLASIEPFVGTPETDIERELVAEAIHAKGKSVTAIDGYMVESEILQERDGHSKGGFERLADFLRDRSHKKTSYYSKSMYAKRAYKYLKASNESEQSLGYDIDRAA